MYKIESNIPVPKALKGARKTDPELESALQLLDAGQSLYVPNVHNEHLMPLQHRVICTISKVKKLVKTETEVDSKFTTRQQGDGIRVWRTA